MKTSKNYLKRLFEFATCETILCLKNKFYNQTDGVAMGSPLAPVLANLYMDYHKKISLSAYSNTRPIMYKRFVEDIFAAFNTFSEAMFFFECFSSRHPNIKLTVETEDRRQEKIEDNIHRKKPVSEAFSCEFCEISENTFSYRTPSLTASEKKISNFLFRDIFISNVNSNLT